MEGAGLGAHRGVLGIAGELHVRGDRAWEGLARAPGGAEEDVCLQGKLEDMRLQGLLEELPEVDN